MSVHKTHPGLIDRARALKNPANFVRSVLQQHDAGRRLSERQLDALSSIVKSATENAQQKTERDNAKLAAAPEVNAQAIHAMFDNAKSNGLKKLKFRMEEFSISPAGENSANPGALYVTGKRKTWSNITQREESESVYYGKIVNGRFMAVAAAPEGIADKINAIAANPLEEAKLYGKRTGTCCICGRALVDPASVGAGIGPICESNIGF